LQELLVSYPLDLMHLALPLYFLKVKPILEEHQIEREMKEEEILVQRE
jgi:hypothetical protein